MVAVGYCRGLGRCLPDNVLALRIKGSLPMLLTLSYVAPNFCEEGHFTFLEANPIT